MAKIKIAALEPIESEIMMKTLSEIEAKSIFGGEYSDMPQILQFGLKVLEFILAIYAIEAITFLATSFSFNDIE